MVMNDDGRESIAYCVLRSHRLLSVVRRLLWTGQLGKGT
jgi:hypothetical protein